MKEKIKTSIVIPAYNEEKRIGKTLETYGSYFKKIKEKGELDFEINVIINNTKDKTEDVVKEYKKIYPEIRYLNFKRGGKGFAVIEGFKDALERDIDLIGFVDADMSTPPNAFYGLIKNIKDYDGIIADRWHKDSKVTPQTILRKILSRGFNILIRILFRFPYNDTQCGAKLFKKEIVKKVYPRLGTSEWSFDVDFLFYARNEGARIKSIPTMWTDMEGSKVNLKKTPITMFLSVVRLRILHSPLKGLIRIYDKLPEKYKFHHRLYNR